MAFSDEDRLSSVLAENEQLRAQNAALRASLHSSEARYRLIVESAADYAIIAADLDGTVNTWNEAAAGILGWSAEEMIGKPLSTIFTPEDIAAGVYDEELRLATERGRARDERWHLKADGSRFFASGEMMQLQDTEGGQTGFLKILRDRTRERREQQELETSRERLRLALEASSLVGTWDWDITADTLYSDARFAHLFGVEPALAEAGAPLSAYVGGIHPDDVERVGARITEAVGSGDIFDEQYRTIDLGGRTRWIHARGRCYHDSQGRPLRFPGAVVDLTQERAREARQAALLRLGDELQVQGLAEGHPITALQILCEALDTRRAGYAVVGEDERTATVVAEWTRDGVPALSGSFDLTAFGPDFVASLRAGVLTVADIEADERTAAGAAAWRAIGVRSVVNMAVVEGGRVRVVLYLNDDRPRSWDAEDVGFVREVLERTWTVTQRRRAEQALADAETRLRLAHEAAEIGSFDFDLVSGTLIWDARCSAAFGLSGDGPVSYEDTFLPALHPDDRARTQAAVEAAVDPVNPKLFDVVYRTIGIEDGVVRWVHASGQTLVENGRSVRFVGAVRDVTEEKEAEERQNLLTRELQHRVKNTLAMVNALANQTLRRAANVQDGLAAFSARLLALGHAHDILTQTSWTSAPIAAIVERSLATHRPSDETRLSWTGPNVRLNARQALALSLALHELATNAAKYGAFSNETGTVQIAWRLSASGEGAVHLLLEWREIGGPPVSPPAARGFGSRLIQQSLASEFRGTVDMHFEAAGLVCVIEGALDHQIDDALPVREETAPVG